MKNEGDYYPSIDKHWVSDDEILATPEHDEMVLWLLKKENIARSFDVDIDDVDVASEVPIIAMRRYIIGYWDVVISPSRSLEKDYSERSNHTRFLPIYVEVKPRIISFGSTLRQLNKYLEYCPGARNRTYIFTKDDQYKDVFEQQRILTLVYTGGV